MQKEKKAYAIDQSTKDVLKGSFFGTVVGDKLMLLPEEALYLMDVRNAICTTPNDEKPVTFNAIASSSRQIGSSWQDTSHTRTGGTAAL